MTAIPTRQDIADRLRALIAGKETRRLVSAWATTFVLNDDCVISDKASREALQALVLADAMADTGTHLYHEADFKGWLDELLASKEP